MNNIEKGAFLKLFNRNGYVLNFSTNDFNCFTMESIGVPLCQKYGLSKGASLTAYCSEATETDIIKLFSDLIEYYELHLLSSAYNNGEYNNLFEKCKKIIEKESKNNVKISTPAITCVNRDYIKDISIRAMQDIDNQIYDSALTKSRTLLEEVFCYVIEQTGDVPSDKGDIGKLYKQVKDLYNMHTDSNMDKRINTLLSGLEKIVSSIAEMRNKASDSHGIGANRITIADHHARLYVNSAMTMADFILSVADKKHNSPASSQNKQGN